MLSVDLLLVHGGAICLIVGLVVVSSFLWRPRIWLRDLPADIGERAEPMTPSERQWLKRVGLVVVVLLFGGLVISTAHSGEGASFLQLAIHAYLLFQLFNLFDLVVLDWGIMLLINPDKPPIPGTEGAHGYRDFRFHAIKSAKGIVLGAPFALVAAGVAWLWHYLT